MIIKALALGIPALVALAACGGSDPTPTPTPTATPLPTPTASPTPSPSATQTPTPAPTVVTFDLDLTADEAEYVEQLRSIDNLMGDLLGSIGEALNVTWPARERLLSVLKDADLSGTLEATLERAQQIDPPDRFRADHQQFLQFLKDALPYVRQHDQSVADDDLVSVFAAQAEALVRRERLSHQTSHDFCRAVLVPDGPPPPASHPLHQSVAPMVLFPVVSMDWHSTTSSADINPSSAPVSPLSLPCSLRMSCSRPS